jgi:Tfp pilus assembly PilM family ATPase/Tfp pilus assembly protein PilN
MVLVLEDWQERLQALKARLVPASVVLAIEDHGLRGQVVEGDQAWAAALPAGICAQGQPTNGTALADFLGDLLLDHGLLTPRVRASLPPLAAHWRLIQWPLGEWPEEAAEAIRLLDPDLRLPFRLDEAYLDLQPLPGTPTQALLVAAPRRLVRDWISVFDGAGAQLDRLQPTETVEWQALQTLLGPADQGVLQVLLALEPTMSRLLIVADGLPCYERVLPGIGQPFQSEAVLSLVGAVQRCIQFWRQQQGGPLDGPERWWLHGPLAAQEGLEALLRAGGVERLERVDLPVVPVLAAPSGSGIDLLRERRAELGVPEPVPGETGRLLRRGSAIGAGLLGLSLAALAFTSVREIGLGGQRQSLQAQEASANQLDAELQQERLAAKKLQESNRKLVSALVSLDSGSALLQALVQVTPAQVQLTEARVEGDGLSLKGLAADPQAYGRINALVLALKQIPLFDGSRIVLRKAARLEAAAQGNPAPAAGVSPAAAAPSPPVNFEIQAGFRARNGVSDLATLQQLQADGLLRRLRVLQQQGVQP